ncbi:MAG: general secretion pathway protein GspK, partial [Chthonomonadaceae bacterium]|nr:general secretion pathway protein GspK [Chthonomonadaceae bacterium]
MKLSMKNSVVVRRRACHARPGQALVPVLLVMLILTILSIAFAVSAQREIKSGTNFVSQTQRYYAARGAAMYAASSLANSSSNGATYGIAQKTGDTDANGWRQIGEAWVKIEVVDSAASLSLNGADLATLQRFPVLKDSPELVAAILDWRTPGDQPSENGAKNEYYSALNPAYNCKNAPYETVEELLLVKGITPTILYGNASGSAISQRDLQSASANSAGGSLSSISSSSRSGTRQAPQPGQAGQGNNGGQGGQNGQGSGQNGGQNG